MTTQLPIARFRAGQVSCAVWENDVMVNGQATTMLKASVSRRYKDRSGEWKSSGSFSRNEILLAIYCLQKAFEAIVAKENEKSDTESIVEEVVR